MHYLNQKDYPHIPYPHTMASGGVAGHLKTVASSGCGLCAAAMAVELLTDRRLDLEESVKWAVESGANHKLGTDMTVYGPLIAEKLDLTYEATDRLETVLAHLRKGGQAVALMHGDTEDAVGLFSHRGHFISLIGAEGGEFCILDPSYTADKFTLPQRAGKVRTEHAPYLYCSFETLHREVEKDQPAYYLFGLKK